MPVGESAVSALCTCPGQGHAHVPVLQHTHPVSVVYMPVGESAGSALCNRPKQGLAHVPVLQHAHTMSMNDCMGCLWTSQLGSAHTPKAIGHDELESLSEWQKKGMAVRLTDRI